MVPGLRLDRRLRRHVHPCRWAAALATVGRTPGAITVALYRDGSSAVAMRNENE